MLTSCASDFPADKQVHQSNALQVGTRVRTTRFNSSRSDARTQHAKSTLTTLASDTPSRSLFDKSKTPVNPESTPDAPRACSRYLAAIVDGNEEGRRKEGRSNGWEDGQHAVNVSNTNQNTRMHARARARTHARAVACDGRYPLDARTWQATEQQILAKKYVRAADVSKVFQFANVWEFHHHRSANPSSNVGRARQDVPVIARTTNARWFPYHHISKQRRDDVHKAVSFCTQSDGTHKRKQQQRSQPHDQLHNSIAMPPAAVHHASTRARTHTRTHPRWAEWQKSWPVDLTFASTSAIPRANRPNTFLMSEPACKRVPSHHVRECCVTTHTHTHTHIHMRMHARTHARTHTHTHTHTHARTHTPPLQLDASSPPRSPMPRKISRHWQKFRERAASRAPCGSPTARWIPAVGTKSGLSAIAPNARRNNRHA